MVSLTAAATCGGCDWTADGKPADVDKAAGKHVKAGHPTSVTSTPGGHAMTRDDPSISGD